MVADTFTISSTVFISYITVMSAPKQINRDESGPQILVGTQNVEYQRPSDEYRILNLLQAKHQIRFCDKFKLIPGHCDPTVNLHNWYFGHRGDLVEALLPIMAHYMLRK